MDSFAPLADAPPHVSINPPRSPVSLPLAMRGGEVVERAHLDETRRGARKLELFRALELGAEPIRFSGGGHHQFHPRVIEGVDQDDEALGLVTLARLENRRHDRRTRCEIRRRFRENPRRRAGGDRDHRMKSAAIRPTASGTLSVRPSSGRFLGAPRRARSGARTSRSSPHRPPRPGGVVDRRAPQFLQPIVGLCNERKHVHALGKELEERQEQRAVQTVLIEVVSRDVGGRDNDDAGGEQRSRTAAPRSSRRRCRAREFVEAQQRGFSGERRGDAAMGSSPKTSPRFLSCRHAWMRACTSAKKAWKWARRFDATLAASKNRSIRKVFPLPTSP